MVKPQLPVAVQEYTVKGAEAFVRYYIDAQNYASQTGDVTALSSALSRDCSICVTIVGHYQKMYSSGASQEGGLWKLRTLRATQIRKPEVRFVSMVSSAPETVYARGKKVKARFGGIVDVKYQFTTRWREGAWVLSAIGKPA